MLAVIRPQPAVKLGPARRPALRRVLVHAGPREPVLRLTAHSPDGARAARNVARRHYMCEKLHGRRGRRGALARALGLEVLGQVVGHEALRFDEDAREEVTRLGRGAVLVFQQLWVPWQLFCREITHSNQRSQAGVCGHCRCFRPTLCVDVRGSIT